MGLGDYFLKKGAKSTAKSIAMYVNGGAFENDDEALRAWASTRKHGVHLIMMIDGLAGFEIAGRRMSGTADIAKALFYSEMDIEENSLSEKTRNEIEEIFNCAL